MRADEPGPGRWAVVLCLGDTENERAGCDPWTTNNRMELLAVINGLVLIASPGQRVRVHLDSSYVRNPFVTGWLERWERTGPMGATCATAICGSGSSRRSRGTRVPNGARSLVTLVSR